MTDPFRMRLLALLAEQPLAVRSIAERLDLPVTRLYYHINLLEQRRLIKVVERRKVGATTRRLYRAAAESFRTSTAFVESIQNDRLAAEAMVADVLLGARTDAESALGPAADNDASRESEVTMGRFLFKLTPEQFLHWSEQLRLLAESIASDEAARGEPAGLYTFTMVLAPAASTPSRAR